MELTHEHVKTIIGMIDDAQHLDEIELVFAGFRLHLRRGGSGDGTSRSFAPGTRARPAPHAPAARQPATSHASSQRPIQSPRQDYVAGGAEIALAEGEIAIRAPMIGTFYRAASPGDKPFVEVGQQLRADDSVGVIEVMKLFNTIRAGIDGTVVRIEAENASLVEFNQVLVVIAASKD